MQSVLFTSRRNAYNQHHLHLNSTNGISVKKGIASFKISHTSFGEGELSLSIPVEACMCGFQKAAQMTDLWKKQFIDF
jgi:hypothetical protein